MCLHNATECFQTPSEYFGNPFLKTIVTCTNNLPSYNIHISENYRKRGSKQAIETSVLQAFLWVDHWQVFRSSIFDCSIKMSSSLVILATSLHMPRKQDVQGSYALVHTLTLTVGHFTSYAGLLYYFTIYASYLITYSCLKLRAAVVF